jgi:dihydroorotate dehydrogenase
VRVLYRKLLKPALFRIDPERVHDRFVSLGEFLGRHAATRRMVELAYGYRGPDASVVVDGLRYRTPVVLAAGFDYNGRLGRILPSVGFGGVEVGSVTRRPSPGNPRPRLRRLVRSGSLLVNKGLRNNGVDRLVERLGSVPRQEGFVTGISIARTNDRQAASLEGGIEDYAETLERLVRAGVGDYYTINISCPNVFGGESFAHPERLSRLMERLGAVGHDRPTYVKMPIDLEWAEFRRLLDVADAAGMNGVVIGNLNKRYRELDHPEEAPAEFSGGLSGRPCFQRSNDLIRRTRAAFGDRFTVIGCGGIMSPADALEKLDAGADLLQLISGMIFEGPHLVRDVARAFASRRGPPGRTPGENGDRHGSGKAGGDASPRTLQKMEIATGSKSASRPPG